MRLRFGHKLHSELLYVDLRPTFRDRRGTVRNDVQSTVGGGVE